MQPLRKRNLLSYLAHIDEADARETARAFGIAYSVAAMGLLRLVRQGLAERQRTAGGVYRYHLSKRGLSRLKYFEQQSRARSY